MSLDNWWIDNVSAVLITRGDAPLDTVLYSLPFKDVVVWDARYLTPIQRAAQMYGRYMAISECRHDLIYVQDDDCIVDVRSVVDAYKMLAVVCNVPPNKRDEYARLAPNVSLVGWGAVFHKARLDAFDTYVSRFPVDATFYREADRVFTYLNRVYHVDAGFRHLPHAFKDDRMGSQPEHLASLAKIYERLKQIK